VGEGYAADEVGYIGWAYHFDLLRVTGVVYLWRIYAQGCC
jgi:hypothetical protein